MGVLGILMYIPIVLWLSDLSPELRMQILQTEIPAMRPRDAGPTAAELPASTREAFARLLGIRRSGCWCSAITANLTLYFAIQVFGPLMFTEAFRYTPAVAARMNANFWFANLAVLVITGIVSDRLRTAQADRDFRRRYSPVLMACGCRDFRPSSCHAPPWRCRG